MYINHILIERFRNLENIELGPFSAPSNFSDLLCIAGPNGSGKSSVLEILTYGLTNRYSWQFHNRRSITDHAFAIKIGLTSEEAQRVIAAAGEPDRDEIANFINGQRGYWLFVNTNNRPTKPFNDAINEKVHGLVSREFANFQRKLGFYIQSDRSYGARGYDNRKIFAWRNRLSDQYLGQISYQFADNQYSDMYEYLVEQSYHYIYDLGLYQQAVDLGSAADRPSNPLAKYNALLSRLFPGHTFEQVDQSNLGLFVKLPNNQVIPFADMSSGEKEVFFLLLLFYPTRRLQLNNRCR